MLRFFMIGRRRSKSPASYAGGGIIPPPYTPGLNFNDARNSMYVSIFPL
jgi:hypothetical protein